MAKDIHTIRGDALARGIGAALVAAAYLALIALERSTTVRGVTGPSWCDGLLAAAAFVAATLGVAGCWLGRHVFDQVAVSKRWRRTRVPDEEKGRLR